MRQIEIYMQAQFAGLLSELDNHQYQLEYLTNYYGPAVSLTLPLTQKKYYFAEFPVFFEGLLPEGIMLEALLKRAKLDRQDYLGQLLAVGEDLVGAVTVKERFL